MKRFAAEHIICNGQSNIGPWVNRYFIEEQEVRQAMAEKDREIAELKEWKSIILGTGTDQEAVIRMAAAGYTQVAVQTWKQAYHALMKQSVEFAENTIYIMGALCQNRHELESNGHVLRARAFLASPEVRAWREQEGK